MAGPLTLGNREENVRRGIEAGIKLLSDGLTPFIPQLNDQFFMVDESTKAWTTEEWLERYDLPWLSQCDALYRLDGESQGADLEIEYALEHDIPVYLESEYQELIDDFLEDWAWE